MKTIFTTIAIAVISISALAQTKQDSITKLKQEIKEKQIALSKLQNKEHANTTNLQSETVFDEIINDLYEMKLITNKETVSFNLSNEKMEVNNKKQSNEVHEKFIKKYKVSKGNSIACSKNKSSSSISVSNSN